jgi:hypothetical protein
MHWMVRASCSVLLSTSKARPFARDGSRQSIKAAQGSQMNHCHLARNDDTGPRLLWTCATQAFRADPHDASRSYSLTPPDSRLRVVHQFLPREQHSYLGPIAHSAEGEHLDIRC